MTTLKLQLTLWEQGVQVRKRTDSPEAYDYLLRGVEYMCRFTKEANVQTRQMCEKAVELDPKYAQVYAVLGWTYFWDWFYQWSPDPQDLERAFALAQKAITLDDSLPQAHRLLGEVYLRKKQHDQALAEVERALALKRVLTHYPNLLLAHTGLAATYSALGREEEARAEAAEVLRLSPNFSLEVLRQRLPYKDPTLAERFLDHRRKVGLK